MTTDHLNPRPRILSVREAWLARDLVRLGYTCASVARWLSSDDREVHQAVIRAIVLGKTYLDMRPRPTPLNTLYQRARVRGDATQNSEVVRLEIDDGL